MVVLNSLRLKISRLAELSNGSAEQTAIEDITTGSPCDTVCVDSADRASVAQPGERRVRGYTTFCMASSLDRA